MPIGLKSFVVGSYFVLIYVELLMKLMTVTDCYRYNDYKHDPLSACNCTPPYSAENAISARCDLNPANGTYPFGSLGHRSHGGSDAKVYLILILVVML